MDIALHSINLTTNMFAHGYQYLFQSWLSFIWILLSLFYIISTSLNKYWLFASPHVFSFFFFIEIHFFNYSSSIVYLLLCIILYSYIKNIYMKTPISGTPEGLFILLLKNYFCLIFFSFSIYLLYACYFFFLLYVYILYKMKV